LRQSCSAAIRSLGEYAPEIDPGDARGLNLELTQLSRVIAATWSGEEGRRVQTGVRAALRAYQQQAHRRLGEMRETVQAAKSAIGEIAATAAGGSVTHRDGVKRELETLQTVAGGGDLTLIRAALGHACVGIRCSHAAFVRAQQVAMLQLRDEVRILRETIAQRERQRDRDAESGAWQREYLEAEIRARWSRKETVSMLVLSIHNLGKLRADHSQEAILGLFEALCKRMAAIVSNIASDIGSNNVMIARWSPNAFALLLPTAQPAAAIADLVSGRLPGAYAVHAGGTSRTLVLDLSVAIVDRPWN
jgi:hypothetical protein